MKIKILLYACKKSNLFARFILSKASNLLIAGPFISYFLGLVISIFIVFPSVVSVKNPGWGPVMGVVAWSSFLGLFVAWIIIRGITWFSFPEQITSTIYIFRKKLLEYMDPRFWPSSALDRLESVQEENISKSLEKRYVLYRKAHLYSAVEKVAELYSEKESLIQLEKLKKNKNVMGL